MEQIASPDKPAYVCYSIVIIVGIWVARAKVNRLMDSSLGRWGFLETWLVFGAYAVVPLALFWFLDFTNALHDTSLFAALLIALTYRQVLTGEVQGTPVPDQFSALWSPFESWANRVKERIFNKNTIRSERFNEELRTVLEKDPARVSDLAELAYLVATDRPDLTAALTALAKEAVPPEVTPAAFERVRTRLKVNRCLQSIRLVNATDWGYVLLQRQFILPAQYKQWVGNATARRWEVWGLIGILGLLLLMGILFFQPRSSLEYYRWRFQKVNATERDRFRTQRYFAAQLSGASEEQSFGVIEPLVRLLRYRDLDRRVGEDILRLIFEFRRPKLNERTIPMLIDALRTDNPDLRLRIHQALQSIRTLAYEKPPQGDELATWVPSKNESAAEIENWIKKYRTWWETTLSTVSPPPVPPRQ